MSSVNIEFYNRLRELRKVHSLTQEKVAHALGVERSTYTNKELGRFPLTLSDLVVLAKLFRISVSELVINVEPTLHPVYPDHGLPPSQPHSVELDDYIVRPNWKFDVR